jgi:hypothetical protein
MKKISLLTLILSLFISYIQNSCTSTTNNPSEIKKQAITIAEDYAMNQIKDAKKTVAKNGFIAIGDKQKMFVIDPSKIYLGLINDDSSTDAIVTLDSYSERFQNMSEQLILTNTDNKIILNSVVESDMRIIEIKDGLITADVPTHSRNSPLFDCKSCREVHKFKFDKGELVKVE